MKGFIRSETTPKGASSVTVRGVLISPRQLERKSTHYAVAVIGHRTYITTESFWAGWENSNNF
jgi:hypothetical protein